MPQADGENGLPERVRRLMNSQVNWHPAFTNLEKTDPRKLVLIAPLTKHGRRHIPGLVQCTFEEFLREHWPIGNMVLRWWLMTYRTEIGDLFQHPEDYPAFVVWSALCSLKFSDEQGLAIREFLTTRVFHKLRGLRTRTLHKGIGYVSGDDWTSTDDDVVAATPHPSDVESDLYEHFATKVLTDNRNVRINLLGYLYQTAKNRLINLRDRAKARPALEIPDTETDNAEDGDAEDKPGTLDEVLSFLVHRRLREEAKRIIEAAESKVDLKRLLDTAQLKPRYGELAVYVIEGLPQVKIAKRMGVTPPRITAMLRNLASNPVLREAYKLSSTDLKPDP